MAHVLVMTQGALDNVNGEEVLAEVTKRLGAHYVFLFIRNDPWFLGYLPNTAPYIFSDSFPRIDVEGYRRSKTLVCYTSQKCRVGPSWY